MYAQLKSRLAELLARPRPLKPQTERQLSARLEEYHSDLPTFLLCAANLMEDHELEILFGPHFTPTLDERSEVADLLFHWRPDASQVQTLVADLSAEVPHAVVRLPDGSDAKLTLHEVMAERYVRLMRLEGAPDPATSAALRDALPAELWAVGVALLSERGMTPQHQKWLAAFVNHVSGHRQMSRPMLETITEFITAQKSLDKAELLHAAEALLRATQHTAAYAAGGHAYWSPDVAQHHHYRGQGRVDQDRLEQRQAEVEHVTAMVEDLTAGFASARITQSFAAAGTTLPSDSRVQFMTRGTPVRKRGSS